MNKVSFRFENTFVYNSAPELNAEITAYSRVFRNMLNGGSLGKILPIYLDDGKTHRIFGILVYNPNGLCSFFPEFPGSPGYDHLTFDKDVKGKHHFSGYVSGKKKKILPIFAEHLSNGIYLALTLGDKDLNNFKEVPRAISYPAVDIEKIKRLEDAFFENGSSVGSVVIKIEELPGPVCIQIQLIPDGIDFKKMNRTKDATERVFPGVDLEESDGYTRNTVLLRKYDCNYDIGISITVFKKVFPDIQLFVSVSCDKSGYYSKIGDTINI